MSRGTLGELEMMVLLAALRLGDAAYGLSISEEISSKADRPTPRASVYVTLRRLEKKGLVATRRESVEEAGAGRPRRLVRLTAEGVALVRETRRALRAMWSGLDEVLGEP